MDFKPFKIGKYLLLEKIATGGMAEVYRAKASGAGGFEKQLAIKRILPNYASNDEFRRMFEYEARLSSMLSHANIAQIYDFVKHGETYLLAMEFIDGKNLRQLINKAKKVGVALPLEFGLFVINEVCKGLDYAHKKRDDLTGKSLNVIHRDMSPQNVMLSYDGAVKIVDFGIAKAKDRVDETRSGVIKGKFGYMSPEQANGENIDLRSDIFSTGIILYELLTNRRLFAGENDMATLRQIQECVIPPATKFNPKITADLERILMKALTKDLTLRYQDAGRFHRGLQEFLNKNFPALSQREMGDLIQKIFADEIVAEKKRFEAVYRQSIPFSQKAAEEKSDGFSEGFSAESDPDEPATKSETRNRSVVTNISGEEIITSISEISQRQEPDSSSGDSPLTKIESVLPEEFEGNSYPGTNPGSGTFKPSVVTDPSSREPESVGDPTDSTLGKTQVGKIDRTQITGSAFVEDLEEKSTQVTGSAVHGDKTGKHRREPSPEATSPSGISLSDTAAAAKGRRRERSISISRDMSSSGSEQRVSLQTFGSPNDLDELEQRKRSRASYTDPYLFKEPPRKTSPVLKYTLLLLLLLFGALYLMDEVQLGSPVESRIPAANAKKGNRTKSSPLSRNPQNQDDRKTSPTYGECTLEIVSDPLGANVYVNQEPRGVTPTIISGECGKAYNIGILLDGYDDVQENIVLQRKKGPIKRTLKSVPVGVLELTTNQNADFFINGNHVGQLSADSRFEQSLKAGKTYQLRFVNEVYKTNFTCSVKVTTGKLESLRVDMTNHVCR